MSLTLISTLIYILYKQEEKFLFILASSLAHGEPSAAAAVMGGADEDNKDRDMWRPDGKGRHGLEEDYEYVIYGKVLKPLQLH